MSLDVITAVTAPNLQFGGGPPIFCSLTRHLAHDLYRQKFHWPQESVFHLLGFLRAEMPQLRQVDVDGSGIRTPELPEILPKKS